MSDQYYNFQLSFKGQLVENSVDAFDVANTIIAFSQALQGLAEIRYGSEEARKLKININAFQQGSLVTDFLLLINDVKDLAVPLVPVASAAAIHGKEVFEVGKEVLSSYKTVAEIKTLLKGRKPKEVKVLPDGRVSMNLGDGNHHNNITINMYDFRALQDKAISKNLAKAFQPLIKEGSLVEEISVITQEKEPITVKKEEAGYISSQEETQIIQQIQYKGVVSKIDSKVCSGYLDIGSKRLPFNFERALPEDQFIILAESLKRRIQIYIVGNVTMDFENNPSNVSITEVYSDIKLF